MTGRNLSARKSLLHRLDVIKQDALVQLEDPVRPPDHEVIDPAEQSETESRTAVDDDLRARATHTLEAVEAARQRVDAGTYGICVGCGAQIAPERLAARPTAARCTACQGAIEQAGQAAGA